MEKTRILRLFFRQCLIAWCFYFPHFTMGSDWSQRSPTPTFRQLTHHWNMPKIEEKTGECTQDYGSLPRHTLAQIKKKCGCVISEVSQHIDYEVYAKATLTTEEMQWLDQLLSTCHLQ